jgi:putative ABC transport system ATP-binding protein
LALDEGPRLTAHRVTKTFPLPGIKEGLTVLERISLSVAPGEILALVGPSGSGKSTLLRCLAGLESVSEGRVTLLGLNLAKASRTDVAQLLRESVALMFATAPLVPSLTSLQNVELPALLAARSSGSTRELALQVLGRLGLADVADKIPSKLTPTQQQRVALARTITQSPRIVFADEPSGRLTTGESQAMFDELVALSQRGTAVVLATHDLHLAAQADRVIALIDGRLHATLRDPTPTKILEALTLARETIPKAGQ